MLFLDGILGAIHGISHHSLNDLLLSAALNQEIESPNRIILDNEHYVTIAVGLPDLV